MCTDDTFSSMTDSEYKGEQKNRGSQNIVTLKRFQKNSNLMDIIQSETTEISVNIIS